VHAFSGERSEPEKGWFGRGDYPSPYGNPWVFFPEGFSGTKFLKKAPEKASLKRVPGLSPQVPYQGICQDGA